jgi:hypothetical protein
MRLLGRLRKIRPVNECDEIKLLIDRKKNSIRKDTPAQAFIKKYWRKRIETTFSKITAFFPRSIHAVTPQGFLLKLLLSSSSTHWINSFDYSKFELFKPRTHLNELSPIITKVCTNKRIQMMSNSFKPYITIRQ